MSDSGTIDLQDIIGQAIERAGTVFADLDAKEWRDFGLVYALEFSPSAVAGLAAPVSWNDTKEQIRQCLLAEFAGEAPTPEKLQDRSARVSVEFLCDPVLDERPEFGRFFILRISGIGFPDLEHTLKPQGGRNGYDFGYTLCDVLNRYLSQRDPHAPIAKKAVPDRPFLITCHPPPVNRGNWARCGINMSQALPTIQKSSDPYAGKITIGHIDTGYSEHPDMVAMGARLLKDLGDNPPQNNKDACDHLVCTSFNSEPGHGTSTATLIASCATGNQQMPAGNPLAPAEKNGILGVAPYARLVPIRVCDSTAFFSNCYAAKGLAWAIKKNCQVVSMSIGGLFVPGFGEIAEHAYRKNMLLITSAGNCLPWVIYPARYDYCLAVGASTKDKTYWDWGPHDPRVDISAPGVDVWTTSVTVVDKVTTYGWDAGTGGSFSTAMMAGAAALWLGFHSARPGEPLQDAFVAAVKNSTTPPPDWNTFLHGAGIIDIAALLSYSGNRPPPSVFDRLVQQVRQWLPWATPEKAVANVEAVAAQVDGFDDVRHLRSALGQMVFRAPGRDLDIIATVHDWFGVLEEEALLAIFSRFGPEMVNTLLIYGTELITGKGEQPAMAMPEVGPEQFKGLLMNYGSKALREALAA
jgi:subtilisin family serine protease